MGMTPMIAPDGTSGEVPASKVADAIKAGGKVGAWMLDPQGNRGVIPLDRTTEAVQAGARPIAPLPDIEKQMPPSGLTTAQQKAKGEYESANLKPIAETLGAIATGGLLKTPAGVSAAEKLFRLAGRSALSGAGIGAGALAAGASPQEAGTAAASGAIVQPVAEGVSAVAKNLAPKIAESALNITDRMRGRGRTIGDAVLEQTTGIKPGTLATETRQAIGGLVKQMEDGVDTATQKGITGSTVPAHTVLDDAMANLPRNAATIKGKIAGLRDLLYLGDKSPLPSGLEEPQGRWFTRESGIAKTHAGAKGSVIGVDVSNEAIQGTIYPNSSYRTGIPDHVLPDELLSQAKPINELPTEPAQGTTRLFRGLKEGMQLPIDHKTFSPNDLLEMKRGIGMEMKSWPPEWQNLDAVKHVQQRLYGALDSELDRIVPGNAEINQTISSLIPAKQQATRMSQGASIAQLMAHRLAAHTGALAASGIGGAVGYREGGTAGAAAGAAAGLALPELLSSPTGQMTLARMLNALGPKATSPELLPLIKAVAAHAVSGQDEVAKEKP